MTNKRSEAKRLKRIEKKLERQRRARRRLTVTQERRAAEEAARLTAAYAAIVNPATSSTAAARKKEAAIGPSFCRDVFQGSCDNLTYAFTAQLAGDQTNNVQNVIGGVLNKHGGFNKTAWAPPAESRDGL